MYVKRGDTITIVESSEFNKTLPVGNYLVRQDSMSGEFYLTPIGNFTLPEKIYGNPEMFVRRYLNTFHDRSGNLGVLLGGVKGTGKSLLAKMLCVQSNLPVLVVTEPYEGPAFKKFLSQIREECIIFMDEFEKMYGSAEHQQSLLSILDGVFEGKKLFLLTANTMKVNDFLTNRPGRIYYSREYMGLTPEVIREVADDLLENKENIDQLLRDLMTIGKVNMDMLISIISEMNRYGETSTEALSYLNIYAEDSYYRIKGEISVSERKESPIRDKNGRVNWDDEKNYDTYLTEVTGFESGNPLSNLDSFETFVDYKSKISGSLKNAQIYWGKEEMDVDIKLGSIKITNTTSDEYLIYTPVTAATMKKVSSEEVITKKETKSKPLKIQQVAEKYTAWDRC